MDELNDIEKVKKNKRYKYLIFGLLLCLALFAASMFDSNRVSTIFMGIATLLFALAVINESVARNKSNI